ncbi:MAG: hypothetical protein ACK491_04770, partial [Pseudanabaena sp.]
PYNKPSASCPNYPFLCYISSHQTAIAPHLPTTDRLFPQNQTAIASYHPINAISYFSINQRSFVRSATKGIILENIKTNT